MAPGAASPSTTAGPPPTPLRTRAATTRTRSIGAEPAHGPFNGGSRVLINGKGFTLAGARIWFGGIEVDETTTIAVNPTQVQVIAPPGTAGAVVLTVQHGSDTSTKRTLAGGYSYDALYAVPSTGPVPGGTVIEIAGQGTQWDATTVARIDQEALHHARRGQPHPASPAPCRPARPGRRPSRSPPAPASDPGARRLHTYQDSTIGYKEA